MIEKLPIMGYSIATKVGEKPFRYTAWVGYDFKRFKANFSDNHGEELYDFFYIRLFFIGNARKCKTTMYAGSYNDHVFAHSEVLRRAIGQQR